MALSLYCNEFVIFPDPNKYGNVSVNPVISYPVYYKFDYRDNVRNVTSGVASGDPKITNKATTFESYTTKERNSTQLKEFNDIFDRENSLTINIEEVEWMDRYGVKAMTELHNEAISKNKKLSIIGMGCRDLYDHFKYQTTA